MNNLFHLDFIFLFHNLKLSEYILIYLHGLGMLIHLMLNLLKKNIHHYIFHILRGSNFACNFKSMCIKPMIWKEDSLQLNKMIHLINECILHAEDMQAYMF